jgi:probable addiction module antidote protein
VNTVVRSSDFDAWLSNLADPTQRQESWLAFVVRPLEISAIANPSAKAFPRCGFMSELGIEFITREPDRPSSGWRRKGLPDERHYQSEENGSRTQEGKTMKKKTTYKAFDAAAYLDNDAVIAEYLSAAAEDPNPDVFVAALGDVAKARGMAQIAKDSGLGRESLYKALSAGAHPRFETINSVLRALGVKIAVVAERGS